MPVSIWVQKEMMEWNGASFSLAAAIGTQEPLGLQKPL
jgi:hypothetical protein